METLTQGKKPEALDQWRNALEQILQSYAEIPYRYGEISIYLLVSQDRNHFLLMQEGWEGQERIHGAIVHAEIRDGKIWLHYDGLEDSVAEELVGMGIAKSDIVLAFHPPELRPHTGYAAA